jgi:hypothetical protein
MLDVNDIAAAESRRQEIAVKAGVALRIAKAEPSVFKDMQIQWFDEFYPAVIHEFGEKMKETEFPGYNWNATLHDVAKLSAEAEQQHTPEEIDAELARLAEESAANELQVTRTGTNQPKVDESGNVVPPIQSEVPEGETTRKRQVPVKPPVATQLPANPVVVVKDDKDKK